MGTLEREKTPFSPVKCKIFDWKVPIFVKKVFRKSLKKFQLSVKCLPILSKFFFMIYKPAKLDYV